MPQGDSLGHILLKNVPDLNGGEVLESVSELIEKVSNEKKKHKERAVTNEKIRIKKLTKKQQQIIEMAKNTVLPDNYIIVWDEDTLSMMCTQILSSGTLALDTETTGLDVFNDRIVGFSVWVPDTDTGYYVPLCHVDNVDQGEGEVGVDYVKCLELELVKKYLKPVLEDKALRIIGHNAKFDSHVLYNNLGIDSIEQWYFDTSIASALLDENRPKKLKELFKIYLKEPADRFTTLFGKEKFNTIPVLMDKNRRGCLAGFYAIKDAYMTWKLYLFFNEALNRKGLEVLKKLMFEMEMPLLPIVWRAESSGVRFDTDYMVNEVAPKLFADIGMCPKCKGFYSIQNSKTPKNRNGKYVSKFYFCECGLPDNYRDGLAQQIWRRTGEFNLKSNPQLADVLFNVLKFPEVDKKKPRSADKKALRKMKAVLKERGRDEDASMVDLLNRFRSESKLTDAFADKLPNSVVNGRVHTNFNTVGTRTLRFSSSKPNLQQLPSKVGGLIRRAFMADEGRLLLSCDFSGQELRILAHVSKCPVLIKIFNEGGDVHAMTSVGIYNRMYEDNVEYEYFQYCRSLQDLFLDKNGEIDSNKLSEDNVKELHNKGLVKTTDLQQLEEEVEKGKLFEKIRKNFGKPINFGLVYGITEIGISENLEVSKEEAIGMIESFMITYPGVATWIRDTQKFILKNKYSLSMCGGKRRLYEKINSGQRWQIESAFRQGVNAVVQRSAAEMTKLATLKLQPLLKEIDAQILLWIHDEIIVDVPVSIGTENIKRITEVMCSALPLCVPMQSDFEIGERWSERMDEDTIERLKYVNSDDEYTEEEAEIGEETEDE